MHNSTSYKRVLFESRKWLMVFLLALVAGGFIGLPGLQAAQETEQPQGDSVDSFAAKIMELEERIKDLGAQVVTLDNYAPNKNPDFKDLQLANQMVEEKNFNERKFDLLIKQFNVFDDELFPLLLKSATDTPAKGGEIARIVKRYGVPGELSFYELQERINGVSLRTERLEKRLERLQINARKKELEEEEKQRDEEITLSTSAGVKIRHLEDELETILEENEKENAKLEELNKKEVEATTKIEELKGKIKDFEAKANASRNPAVRALHQSSAKARRIRLNGLEIPRRNTIRTFIYLTKTEINKLEDRKSYNLSDIESLKEQRNKELINKLIKGVIVIIGILFAVSLVMGIIRKVAKKLIARMESSETIDDHHKQRYQTLSAVSMTFIKVGVWAVAIILGLDMLDIPIGPFMLVAGALSLAIGFGAQSLVKDIVSGFFILMEEQFALGDSVEVSGVTGSVEKITLRAVKIRSLDGTLHSIPSGSISKVSNKTYQWSRSVVKVGVGYDNDAKRVMQVLKDVAMGLYNEESWKEKFLEEPVTHGILAFEDSAVMYRITAKTKPGSQWGINRELMIRIKTAFEKEGIDIPYNYMNINVLEHTKK